MNAPRTSRWKTKSTLVLLVKKKKIILLLYFYMFYENPRHVTNMAISEDNQYINVLGGPKLREISSPSVLKPAGFGPLQTYTSPKS